MEDLPTTLLDKLEVNDTRKHQYKEKYPKFDQEERRRQCLEVQRKKRNEVLDLRRGVDFNKVEEFFHKNNYDKVNFVEQKNAFSASYRKMLMLSEWLTDVPADFSDKWLAKLCPVGKRVLVVAEKGWTICYTRRGHFLKKFISQLPGGSFSCSRRGSCTILDCISDFAQNTLYVLDVLYWGYSMVDCPADFRMFWLRTKLSETPELSQISNKNILRFVELEFMHLPDLYEAMKRHPLFPENNPRLDGIVFFHSDGLYVKGEATPLVTWLKAYMFPTVLDVQVHPNYENERDLPSQVEREMDFSTDSAESPSCPEEQMHE